MKAPAILKHAERRGVNLHLRDDRLAWAGNKPAPRLLAVLRKYRGALEAHLRADRERQEQAAILRRILPNAAPAIVDASDMPDDERERLYAQLSGDVSRDMYRQTVARLDRQHGRVAGSTWLRYIMRYVRALPGRVV